MNRREFPAAASTAVRPALHPDRLWRVFRFDEAEPPAGHHLGDFAATEVRGHKDDGLRQIDSPALRVSRLSSIPSNNCQSASLAFNLVEQQNDSFSLSVCVATKLPA